jgi:hypothetical protein
MASLSGSLRDESLDQVMPGGRTAGARSAARQIGALSAIPTRPGTPAGTSAASATPMSRTNCQTVAARKSADRASARIAWLNVVLVLLTVALVALTVVLAVRS